MELKILGASIYYVVGLVIAGLTTMDMIREDPVDQDPVLVVLLVVVGALLWPILIFLAAAIHAGNWFIKFAKRKGRE